MNFARRSWSLTLVFALGIVLMNSTKPTAACSVVSSSDPIPQPSVGVLFSEGFNAYLRAYLAHRAAAHHASGGAPAPVQPVAPAGFFDRR